MASFQNYETDVSSFKSHSRHIRLLTGAMFGHDAITRLKLDFS